MRYWPLLFLSWIPAAALEKAAYDSNGRIIALLSDAEDFEATSNLVAVLPSGKRVPLQVRVVRQGVVEQGVRRMGDLAWSGTFRLPDGGRGRLELKSDEQAERVKYSATVTAETPLDVDAIEFVLDLPRLVFAGGRVEPEGGETVPMAKIKPPNPVFYRSETAGLRFQDGTGAVALRVAFDGPRPAAIVDRWDERGRSYQVRAVARRGALAPKEVASLTVTLSLENKPAAAALARLVLDASRPRYRFDGFGGNYCWDNRSPISAYTLKNLKLAWGRTEMKVLQWDKERDNPGPALRADFETMRRFHEMGVPYAISIWWLPERFYTDPYEQPRMAKFRLIAPEKWDELLDLLGSYLLYAKREYGVEPDLFSFNEANLGVYVGQTPETHTAAIKRIGAHFQRLGLKTRMLLGDATGPRDTHRFALTAAADPEAMQFVGAVAFHSWGGGTPEQYRAWGDVAEWLNLPLLVSELGVDAAAYHTRSWNSYHYGLREARMTQELLLYARPQGTQFWQFTNDYALARLGPDGAVQPTPRFWLMKHFTDLTPHKSEVLATSSDQPQVLFTAFRAGTSYALHVLNLGPAREAAVEGLPDSEWQPVETTEAVHYQSRPGLRAERGTLRLRLAAGSLTSLTAEPTP
jgi:hypothetical protein